MRNKLLVILFLSLSQFGFSQKINTSLTYSVIQPTVKTPKPPVLIILHGYGSDENDFLDLAKSVDPRFMKFTLRAPNLVHQGAYCWYRLNFLTNGDFTYDYEEVKTSRAKLLAFISEACKTYALDSTQVFIMGFSQGAIMSYELALFAPAKIKGILPLSGRLMKESRNHKTTQKELAGLKVFIAHGNSDERIKPVESELAMAYLKSKQIVAEYKTYNMGHSVSAEETQDIKLFLSKEAKF